MVFLLEIIKKTIAFNSEIRYLFRTAHVAHHPPFDSSQQRMLEQKRR